MTATAQLVLLSREAFRDALRERVGLGVLVLAALLCLWLDRCSAGTSGIVLNGRMLDPELIARTIGPISFSATSLLLSAGTGLIACDLLARPLEQGIATLWLARPVSRELYALSRLCGALALGLLAALFALGLATALLVTRSGLSPIPGLVGLVVHALDAAIVAALSMGISLFLPRLLAFFLVLGWVQAITAANLAHVLGLSFGGWFDALERFGPPLGTALLHAVSPWAGVAPDPATWLPVGVKLAIWLAGSIAWLLWSVRRIEPR